MWSAPRKSTGLLLYSWTSPLEQRFCLFPARRLLSSQLHRRRSATSAAIRRRCLSSKEESMSNPQNILLLDGFPKNQSLNDVSINLVTAESPDVSTTAKADSGSSNSSNNNPMNPTDPTATQPTFSSSSPPSVESHPLSQKLRHSMQYVEYFWKREVALLKYYGLVKYMQNHYRELIHSRLFTTAPGAPSGDNASFMAKVPFVITVKMRTELMNDHGYSEEEIRQMTPQQAHSILLEEGRHSSPNHQTVDEFHATTVKDAQSVSEFLSSGTMPVGDTTPLVTNNPTEGTVWYEIVEHSAGPDTPVVVAMYLEEKDAQYGLTIYEELAQRKHPASGAAVPSSAPATVPTYQIRTTLK